MENFDIITYLIVCPLVFLAGFVDAIGGGGGLISLPAYLIAGLPPVVASATNKLSAGMGASVSFANYYNKGFVNIKLALPCILVALIMSGVGAKIQTMIPENYLKIFMLFALPLTMIFSLNKNNFIEKERKKHIKGKELLYALLIAFFLGLYDGIYGPGTGIFLIIFFVNIVGMNIKDANGIAKAINFSTNIGSLFYFIYAGKAMIVLGLVAGISNMIGCYIGSNLFVKKGVKIARPIMLFVMSIFIIKISLELLNII